MKKVNKLEILKYVLIFIYFFLCFEIFFQGITVDFVYNYGFSYSLIRGELPYVDFNMIIPPLGPFLYAIPLKIFGIHYIVFNIFQSFLATIFFYYLFKLLDKKAYILLVLLSVVVPLPFWTVMSPGYNFLILFELVLLVYLEKNNSNDYLIGLILGFAFLTKQTVGLCLCLPTLYYLFKDYKKVLKRIGGFLIPISITVIYLLIIGGLIPFIDQCFLGMFDFSHNSGVIDIYFYVFIMILILTIIRIVRDKKNLLNYYFLFFLIQSFPLFDFYHVTVVCFTYIIMLLLSVKVEMKKGLLSMIILCVCLPIIWFLFFYHFSIPKFRNINHFNGYIMSDGIYNETLSVTKYIKKNKDKNMVLFIHWAYFSKIVNDLDIVHYDLINRGNNGYHSTQKIIDRLKKEKQVYVIINTEEYNMKNKRQQINKDILKYVIDNYKVVDMFDDFVVYYKE